MLRPPIDVQPVVLEGRFVRLEPAKASHAESLAKYGDKEIFQFFMTGAPSTPDAAGFAQYIETCRAMPNVVPFTMVKQDTSEAIGMSSYLDIRPTHLGVEIGMTWIGRPFQGTAVNPEAKLLMLTHAFEVLGCERVQLKTDGRNFQSQAAIEKLGAQKEGVLRSHAQMFDGYIRDTVMYSILPGEWAAVKAGLEKRLAAF